MFKQIEYQNFEISKILYKTLKHIFDYIYANLLHRIHPFKTFSS